VRGVAVVVVVAVAATVVVFKSMYRWYSLSHTRTHIGTMDEHNQHIHTHSHIIIHSLSNGQYYHQILSSKIISMHTESPDNQLNQQQERERERI
jgi:hypothetical protein